MGGDIIFAFYLILTWITTSQFYAENIILNFINYVHCYI